ncbi:MAG: hypothetical protein U1F70_04695 [Candidatus Competibacteraceae bacterium]
MNSRRDYKSVTTGPRRQRARRHGLLVVTLVLIGLFGGLLAYIRGDRTRPPPAAIAAPTAPTAPAQPPATPAAPPKAVVAPVAELPPVKPKYDFYTELPKRQIDIKPETVNPRIAPPATPTRTQPAADPLQKPAAPRKNVATPIMAAASVKPDAKPASVKPDAKPASVKPDAKPASVKPDAKPASVKPDAKPASVKPANAQSTPGTMLARTTQPPRPLAENGSKIVVKTERAP